MQLLMHIQQIFYQCLYRASFCLDPDFHMIALTSTLGGNCIGFDVLRLKTSQEGRRHSQNHSQASSQVVKQAKIV